MDRKPWFARNLKLAKERSLFLDIVNIHRDINILAETFLLRRQVWAIRHHWLRYDPGRRPGPFRLFSGRSVQPL